MAITQDIEKEFYGRFARKPLVVRSPGRVNLIGEHTDYNEGFVLPAAIDKAIWVGIAPREDGQCHLVSLDYSDTFTFTPAQLTKSDKGWPNYIMGVVQQFAKRGHPIPGFSCVFGGDVPVGAGLSSSAALECAMAFALNEAFNLGLDKLELVKIAQHAEIEFVGVRVGIMDQFISVFGQDQRVLKLDCRSLEYELVPVDFTGVQIVLCNTEVEHSLASSEYNTRRGECEKGVAVLQKHYPNVRSLRDVTLEMLHAHQSEMEPVVLKRCEYVIEENERLLTGVKDLESGNLAAFGQKMYGSHYGLRDKYQVSCPELDFLVAQTENDPAVIGSRMMGGGFGGCTINLVKEGEREAFVERISAVWKGEYGRDLPVYVAQLQGGTRVVSGG